jgi:Zn-dependent M28 family amino/carboxypeptidase
VHISDDLVSNGSWTNAGVTGVYFEGTNVLVKVDGTDSERHGGVLFSAHYDSVSTAPGATDNGMAVVTLLRLVQLFAENRGRKTVVFNINNGEEDGLNGAHA